MSRKPLFIIAVLLGLVCLAGGVALTLLTPLKHVALITPTIYDVPATSFYERFKNNPDDFVFIDVRGQESYNRIHAEGSKSMPLHTLYDEWRNLPKNTDKTIVLICSVGRASGVGYHYLQHHGFFNIERIEGGIEGWEMEGLPVVTTF